MSQTLTLEIAKSLVAEATGDLDDDYINASQYSVITEEAAQALAKHEYSLYLDGLTSLSVAAAQALRKHQGRALYLRGLTSLSDAAADALAKHEGELYLSGLTSLSDAAAEALARHKGPLHLDGLISVNNQHFEILRQQYLALNT